MDFLLVCHIPPTVVSLNLKELPINLPLGQNYPSVFASHTGFHLTLTYAYNFGDSLSSCLKEFGPLFSLMGATEVGSCRSCCFGGADLKHLGRQGARVLVRYRPLRDTEWDMGVVFLICSCYGLNHVALKKGMWKD